MIDPRMGLLAQQQPQGMFAPMQQQPAQGGIFGSAPGPMPAVNGSMFGVPMAAQPQAAAAPMAAQARAGGAPNRAGPGTNINGAGNLGPPDYAWGGSVNQWQNRIDADRWMQPLRGLSIQSPGYEMPVPGDVSGGTGGGSGGGGNGGGGGGGGSGNGGGGQGGGGGGFASQLPGRFYDWDFQRQRQYLLNQGPARFDDMANAQMRAWIASHAPTGGGGAGAGAPGSAPAALGVTPGNPAYIRDPFQYIQQQQQAAMAAGQMPRPIPSGYLG
jgi:hypothetical protein